MIDNPRFPHTCRITRVGENDPLSSEEDVVTVYEGECRAYEKNTTSDSGDVISSFRGLAVPVDRKGWMERGIVPFEDDYVVVDRGGYEESGKIIDVNPANFGGTHIIWRYGRN